MTPSLRPGLDALEGYHSPQVDVRVRLNNNESPYPPPPSFVEELTRVVSRIPFNRYPDRRNRALRRAVADFAGVDEGHVFAANGSNEVLQTLLLAYGGPTRSALAFTPTYTLHGQIARVTGTPLVTVARTPDFAVTAETVATAVAEHEPHLVFFCNPNNPTGLPEDTAAVEVAADDPDRLVVVDEAYAEFAPTSMLDLAGQRDNVVIVRTLSKAWAIPACRVGYLIASSELVMSLEAAELPYHVSALTQEAGRLALAYEPDMRERVSAVVRERERVLAAVSALAGVDVWPSVANFLLIRPHGDTESVWQGLLERGVLVRNFAARADLPGCLRVTVGNEEENNAFLAALGAALASGGEAPASGPGQVPSGPPRS
ncbi:MAG: histidinol-phosphate transaminase [Acidimicrobiia bacterium]|nr:histidinol-phosphate transaminase [Acidimicrobiia bacterium]